MQGQSFADMFEINRFVYVCLRLPLGSTQKEKKCIITGRIR